MDGALSGDQKQIFGGIGQDHVQKLPILRVVVTAAAVLPRSLISGPKLSASGLEFSARNRFFLACDLIEIPRRIAALFMASGERPVCLTTSSSEVEERASSINRRSSLNDQRRFTIMKPFVSDKAAKRSMFAWRSRRWVGPDGNCPVPQSVSDPLNIATNAAR